MQSLATELRDLNEEIRRLEGQAAEKYQEHDALVESYRKKGINPLSNAEAFAAVDELGSQADELKAKTVTLRERATKIALRIAGTGVSRHGGTPDGDVTGWAADHWGRFAEEMYGGGIGASAITPSGTVTVPAVSDGIVSHPDRPRRILEVLAQSALRLRNTDQHRFLREITRQHNAAPVAPGAKKPTSNYAVEPVDGRVRTIAHLTPPIERQTLADAPVLMQYLDGSLSLGVILALEDQIVSGDGTGENLLGFAEDPDRLDVPFTGDLIATARKAVTKLEEGEIYSGYFLFSPAVWEAIELIRTDDEAFLLGGAPVDRVQRRLWGKQVVVSSAVPDELGFLVDLDGSLRLVEREGVRVDWSENVYDPLFNEGAGATDFERNMLRFRAEGRWDLQIQRPRGIVEFPTEAPTP